MKDTSPLCPGDRVYLVPNLATAPRHAYRQPRCVITAIGRPGTASYGLVEVELDDGHRLWTNKANVQRRPRRDHTPVRMPAPKRHLTLAHGETEQTLW